MTDLKQISIPKPCHQSWQQMTELTGGRHCQRCSKTVIDFTTMPDDGIITYLSKHQNTCGRFDATQFKSINHKIAIDDGHSHTFWMRMVLAISMISQVTAYRASAQTKPATVQVSADALSNVPVTHVVLGKVDIRLPAAFRTINGDVTAADDHLPIEHAIITIPSTNFSAATDHNGHFTIQLPLSATRFSVSLIGFERQDITIDPNRNDPYKVIIKPNNVYAVGEVVVIRTPFFKRMYYRLIKKPIRRIFN